MSKKNKDSSNNAILDNQIILSFVKQEELGEKKDKFDYSKTYVLPT